MALSIVVFDVGETLVDEATTYERWEAEGVPAEEILDGTLTIGSLTELPEALGRV